MKVIDVENTVESSGKSVLICASEIEDLPSLLDRDGHPYYQVNKTSYGFSWKGMDEPLLPGEKHVGEPL
jgi:hypothetical protein